MGYEVARFIEDRVVVPDRDVAGEKFRLTDEQYRFVLWMYRLDPDSDPPKFTYHRGAQLVRPQKWGKGPLSAAIAIAEAWGPVLPLEWDKKGDPVGRPWATPWIQITAVSEDQTDNVWRSLQPMIELGDLRADIPDTGITRINLPGGGVIEPVTASARSRLGQRITFAVQDESHSMTVTNRGRALIDNQRRNLAGMGGRWLETTNAWDPIEGSVAEDTAKSKAPGVYRDDVEPGTGSIRNRQHRRRMLPRVYGDSATGRGGWVDLDRIDAEIVDLLERDPAQAERFFLNRKLAAEAAAFDPDEWAALADPKPVPDGTAITIGVDGARYQDALAVVATVLDEPYQFPLGIWERPERAGDDYEHDLTDVDRVMRDAFERFDPVRVYVDPQWIDSLVDEWLARWGPKRIWRWLTHRQRPMAYALRAYRAAMSGGDFGHDGDDTLTTHIRNARRRPVNVYDDERRRMWIIAKDHPGSANKIDGAMAACLSWEARGDAIAAGETTGRRSYRAAGF